VLLVQLSQLGGALWAGHLESPCLELCRVQLHKLQAAHAAQHRPALLLPLLLCELQVLVQQLL
jgi:hypothetical protein